MTIIIDHKKCCWQNGSCKSCSCEGACKGCVEVCPVKAVERKDVLVINNEQCINCGACINACKHNALSFSITIN